MILLRDQVHPQEAESKLTGWRFPVVMEMKVIQIIITASYNGSSFFCPLLSLYAPVRLAASGLMWAARSCGDVRAAGLQPLTAWNIFFNTFQGLLSERPPPPLPSPLHPPPHHVTAKQISHHTSHPCSHPHACFDLFLLLYLHTVGWLFC